MTLPPSFISGNAYLQPSQTPRTLTAITWSNFSSGYSAIGFTTPSIPALLKKTSIFPNASTALAT
ncbi:hypothetical protein D3C83_295150 [compost metagenome]